MRKNHLLDTEFLKKISEEHNREIYVKITSLDFDEHPIEEIQGRASQGSISIDGTSSSRRTCSLTLAASEMNLHEYYWGLNTKFKLEVGLKNNINLDYEDIVWFPYGIFLISSFSTSQATNSYTINIQGKDKMSLLNGDVGGVITALTHDFGQIDEVSEDGTITTTPLLLKDIITEVVHEYAREPYHNIIVNDLDDAGVELIEYKGEQPMYFIVNRDTEMINMSPNLDWNEFWANEEMTEPFSFNIDTFVFDPRIELHLTEEIIPTIIYANVNGKAVPHSVIKAEYGDVVGYRITDLTYAGDLIGAVGEAVTSACLDKIKNMLGDYEYFYNTEGQFVFQRKHNYVNVSWNNIVKNEDEIYEESAAMTSARAFSFTNSNVVASYQNNPDLANLKNDYSIWGTKQSTSGAQIPVHLRYALDERPLYYKNYNGDVFISIQGYKEIENNYNDLLVQYNYTYETIKTEKIKALEKYKKKKNPNGLPEDWWEIMDWAEYYKILKGHYPEGQIGQYANEGHGNFEIQPIDLLKYFKNGRDQYHLNGPVKVYIFDIFYPTNGDIQDSYIGYTGHGVSCSHLYSYFTARSENKQGTSFIYKPVIPQQDFEQQIEDETAEALKSFEVIKKMEYYKEQLDKLKGSFVDWREIIYQMSIDYLQHNHDDDFLAKIAENNRDYYPSGYTGYEQYYTDINSFWRQLYDPSYSKNGNFVVTYINRTNFNDRKKDLYRYVQCSNKIPYVDNRAYYLLTINNGYVLKTVSREAYNEHPDYYYYTVNCKEDIEYDAHETYYIQQFDNYYTETNTVKDEKDRINWNKIVFEAPDNLNFWFDFLDTEGELDKYKVNRIGLRSKSENNTNVKSIYNRETPTIIFVPSDLTEDELNAQREEKQGYSFIQLPNYLENYFNISSQGMSAKDRLDELLYSNVYCTESISLSTIPVYHLEPNVRIFVRDDNSGINGDYIISKMTIPLNHNGMMSINATKAVNRLY